jgi:hypothetical protein
MWRNNVFMGEFLAFFFALFKTQYASPIHTGYNRKDETPKPTTTLYTAF